MFKGKSLSTWGALLLVSVLGVGCSSAMKARQAEREKISSSAGFICEFLNGEDFADIDVQLNISMAKRCDAQKPFSISSYKNSSDIFGVLFCCNTPRDERLAPKVVSEAKESKGETTKAEVTKSEPAKSEVRAEKKGAAKKVEEKGDLLGD